MFQNRFLKLDIKKNLRKKNLRKKFVKKKFMKEKFIKKICIQHENLKDNVFK